jgi:hypothetical protein
MQVTCYRWFQAIPLRSESEHSNDLKLFILDNHIYICPRFISTYFICLQVSSGLSMSEEGSVIAESDNNTIFLYS